MRRKLSHDAFQSELSSSFSHIVCSASFEARAEKVADLMKGASLTKAFVLQNAENERVAASSQGMLRLFGDRAVPVRISGSDPIATSDALNELVRTLIDIPGKSILIDISTMMRETMLMLLGLLHQMHPQFDELRIAYNSANYPESDDDAEGDTEVDENDLPWLSYGVSDVRSVVSYPGNIDLSGDRHLLILMGFEVSRAEGIIYARDPAYLSIGYDAPGHSTTKRNAKLNKYFVDELKSRASGPVNLFAIFPDDADATAAAIQREINLVGMGKPIVAGMNTKVATCGAAIAAWSNPSIELVYAQPALYNFKDYSRPTNEIYLFTLPK